MPDRLSLQETAEDGHALLLLKQSEYWPALSRLVDRLAEDAVQSVLTGGVTRYEYERGRYYGICAVKDGIERGITDAIKARDHLRHVR